jgi:hypothetical protein
MRHYDAEDGKLTKIERPQPAAGRCQPRPEPSSRGEQAQGDPMRISLDWWALLAAAVAVVLIKTGLVAGIPW